MTKRFELNTMTDEGIHIQSFLKAIRRSKDLTHWFKHAFNYPVRHYIGDHTLLHLSVDYPFHKDHCKVICITPYTTIADVMVEFAKFYSKLYKTPAQSEVWGHCLADLAFEYLYIKDDGTARVSVGS